MYYDSYTLKGIPRMYCKISRFPHCTVKIPYMHCIKSGNPRMQYQHCYNWWQRVSGVSLAIMAQRLVNRENRQFNPGWTVNLSFFEGRRKPLCLNYNKAINKAANLNKHYKCSHLNYDGRYLHGTSRRTENLNRPKDKLLGRWPWRGCHVLRKSSCSWL